jgi:carbamate kinase
MRHTLLDGRVLRSGDQPGVEQELWALLTVCQLLRRAMVTAVEIQPGTNPDRACCAGSRAVVDKELTASLLARQLHVGALLLFTDVEAAQEGYGTPKAGPIRRTTQANRAGGRSRPGPWPHGRGGVPFVEATGKRAAIGWLSDACALLAGAAGTIVSP